MKEKIFRSFNLGDEALSVLEGLAPDASVAPQTVDEADAIEEYDAQFLVRFTYNSNAIEGSTLTLGDTQLIFEGEFPAETDDKRLSDVFAAMGIKEGCELADARLAAGAVVDEELVKDIHQAVALDCQPRTRGVYRVVPVYITNSQTVPANPDRIRELMADLVFAYGNSAMHPVAKAAAFHAVFENIHPFRDGNGRCGRVILNYMLKGAGYPPIAIKASGKREYARALEDWQVRDDAAPLLRLVRSCIEEELQGRRRALELTRAAVSVRK